MPVSPRMQRLHCCWYPTTPRLICYPCGPERTELVNLRPTADMQLSLGGGCVVGLEQGIMTQAHHMEHFATLKVLLFPPLPTSSPQYL